MKMDLASVSKGVVGLVFGNEVFSSDEDSHVERLLDRISNGTLAEERRTAIAELQYVVAETQAAQLAFGAIGFPVLMGVLREERDDVEMVRGALETLVSGLTPIPHVKGAKNEVQPAKMNADLLSREAGSISLLLSLLSEEDFYVRYFTLKLLTALLANSPSRLQEAILSIPQGITQLMDMLMDREVIRNEALLLLTNLTREAEEIQKIVVFEGGFEKIFSIIKEEGGSDGGVVVQDCLVLLNNLLQNNASNQVLLRETLGFDPLIYFLRPRGSSYSFTQQKTVNLLSALETINLLIEGVPGGEPGKNSNRLNNIAVLTQKKILDHLLMLGVECQWAHVSVRCMALRCIGDLIAGHPKNLVAIASMVLGEEPDMELALNSLLRVIMRTSSMQEFIAADYVFKSFCEKNYDGQIMLASTLIPQPYSMTHAPPEEDVNMSFGSMLLHGLTPSENDGDLETCCRAASVFCHILKDNIQCKEKVLLIELDAPAPLSGAPEPLLHRIVKYLALASPTRNKDGSLSFSNDTAHIQPIILKLLITWLSDCPAAVRCFLDSRSCPHLSFLLELVSNPSATPLIKGLAALLLGECILYSDNQRDNVVDEISRKVGLSAFFLKFEEMHKTFPFSSAERNQNQSQKLLTRSNASFVKRIEESDQYDENNEDHHHPVIGSVFDSQFVVFVSSLEEKIREGTVESYRRPKSDVAVVPKELDQRDGEGESQYIERLKSYVEKQCSEIQDLLGRNASMAEAIIKPNNSTPSSPSHPDRTWSGGSVSSRFQIEMLHREIAEASQRLEMARSENVRMELQVSTYRAAAEKTESELRSLSDAYNSLEAERSMDLEAARRESESELNDLLVCLGQEQSKVEKLSARLVELGEDVDELLSGVGDDLASFPLEDED